jgi:hypothetical protein
MPSPKPTKPTKPKLPPDLFAKGKEILKQAQKCPAPDLKQLMMDAAERYYDADIKQNTPLPLWGLSVMLVIFYLLVVSTLVWSYSQLTAAKATFVVIAAFSFLSLLVGAILRVGGYISESGFLAVWKAGFKAVTSLKREGAKTDKK